MEKQDPNSWEILVGFGGGTSVDFARLSGGVMVAQGPLEAFVMVRIHAGQPLKSPTKPAFTEVFQQFHFLKFQMLSKLTPAKPTKANR